MFVQICRAYLQIWGADQMERGVRLESIAKTRRAEAEEALASGADNANILAESASALENASKEAFGQAVELAASAPLLLVYAIVAILLLKGIQGLLANRAMNARYQKWCADPSLPAGFNIFPTIFMTAFITLTYGLTAFRFASASAPEWLKIFPANRTWRLQAESLIDLSFQWMTETWSVFFLKPHRYHQTTAERYGNHTGCIALASCDGSHYRHGLQDCPVLVLRSSPPPR